MMVMRSERHIRRHDVATTMTNSWGGSHLRYREHMDEICDAALMSGAASYAGDSSRRRRRAVFSTARGASSGAPSVTRGQARRHLRAHIESARRHKRMRVDRPGLSECACIHTDRDARRRLSMVHARGSLRGVANWVIALVEGMGIQSRTCRRGCTRALLAFRCRGYDAPIEQHFIVVCEAAGCQRCADRRAHARADKPELRCARVMRIAGGIRASIPHIRKERPLTRYRRIYRPSGARESRRN
jgi:hypothetical protein